MIEGFLFFLVLVFLIPSLLLTLYALATYRALSKLKAGYRVAVTLLLASTLSLATTQMAKLPIEYASLLGTVLMLILATQIALGMNISIIPFEKRTTEEERRNMFLSFSIILAIIFLWGFSNAMTKPTYSIDFMHFLDYRSVVKLGKFAYFFISSFVLFVEAAAIAFSYFLVCYIVIKAIKS
ncbi:hypothetical protein [Ferroglobus placidus]|uniref:hypothetical protein n=1 Tax=Ferroglobus placidus TaxID=54261 RepID=UPI0001B76D73|nr:hypothetical protein [Ferroglobus placidus]